MQTRQHIKCIKSDFVRVETLSTELRVVLMRTTVVTRWNKKGHHQKSNNFKILFTLTQSFSYIWSSLCSRDLQSFKSVLQKLFVSPALKKCAPNELPGAAGTFGSGGQSSRWPSRIPPLGSLLLLPSCQGLSLH